MSISPAQLDVLPVPFTRSQRARLPEFFSIAASVPETRTLVVEVEEVLADSDREVVEEVLADRDEEPEPLL